MNNCDTDISGDCPVRHSPVFRRSVFYYIGTTSDPATGLIFTKPQNSSGAARVALPQTAVAIVWRRSAFDVRSFPIDEHASSGVCWRSSRPLIFGFPDGGRHGGSWFKENISDE